MTKKKTVIAVVTALIVALTAYIILHHNPFADPGEEMVKNVLVDGHVMGSSFRA